MDSRDSAQSTASVNNSIEDDGGVLSVTATLAKEAALYFQSRKFDECLDLLKQLLEKKPDDPKIMWLVDIFRAKVVDTSEHSLTIEVTGDPGKMVAVQRNLSKFGIKEIARTRKIALRREKMGETAPFWNFSTASYPDLEEKRRNGTVIPDISRSLNGNENVNTSSRGDVYPVEPYDDFPVNQVLDAHWGVLYDEDSTGLRSHTLSMLVSDTPEVNLLFLQNTNDKDNIAIVR